MKLQYQENNESEPISFPDAIANPRAVMVVGRYTVVAPLAVLAPQRLLDVADGAVLVLYKKHNVVALLFLYIVDSLDFNLNALVFVINWVIFV